MISHLSHVMTLANGIIGVSVLAMPFCFKQCGIILATVVLLMSCTLSRLACHFLVKSAVMSRRRNFELLAFHAFGKMGKFAVELFIIGFLIGTCIAFFVVVGDLGPQIIGKLIDKNPEDIRTSLLITTGAFIVLPLGLLRNIDSLSTICTATIGFYFCLVLKVIGESSQHIFAGDWYNHVYYWRPAGILQCLPIFSMALFCQTQLFAIYETIPNVSLEKMNQVVRGALNICTLVYMCVGFFGYIAFCTQPFSGNVLMSLEPNLSSEIIKMGFVISVAFSFPLVIFPCRASLNSLLFRRVHTHEAPIPYMPETRFRCLTFTIVCISLISGILIPNIEFVLGLVGSTIGVVICLICPAAFFISISSKNTNERLVAQAILFVGIWIMVLGTYANLYAMEGSMDSKISANTPFVPINDLPINVIKNDLPIPPNVPLDSKIISNVKEKVNAIPDEILEKHLEPEDGRREPPVPVERVVITEKVIAVTPESVAIEAHTLTPNDKISAQKMKTTDERENRDFRPAVKMPKSNRKVEELIVSKTKQNIEMVEEKKNLVDSQKSDNLVNADAIRKEDSELASFDREMSIKLAAERHEELIKTLEKHKQEQLQMMAEQKELLKDIKEQKKFEKTRQEIAKEKSEKKKNGLKGANGTLISKSDISDKHSIVNNNEAENILDTKNDKLQASKGNQNLNKSIKNVPSSEIWVAAEKNSKNNEYKKMKGPILSILTKNASNTLVAQDDKSSLLKNEAQAKSDSVQTSYQMPIAITLRNHSKIAEPSLPSVNENTPENIQVIGRDILQNHDRQKREIDEPIQTNDAKFHKDLMNEKIGHFMTNVAINVEKVKCEREDDKTR